VSKHLRVLREVGLVDVRDEGRHRMYRLNGPPGLADINALADSAPGFVWRFQTEAGDATAVRPYDDDRILINLSVWESPEALQAFVFRSAHAEVMRQRRQWFARMDDAYVVPWWVLVGHRPSVEEAIGRLDSLRIRGESPAAFSFKRIFPPLSG
jgi:hypothetical protein